MTALMVQGTTSWAGKRLLTTALARAFRRRGVDVVPFKAMNMSNNARRAIEASLAQLLANHKLLLIEGAGSPLGALRWAFGAVDLERASLVVPPGSKHVAADLEWPSRTGLAETVCARAAAGGPVLGVCLHGLFEQPSLVRALLGAKPTRSLDDAFDELADAAETHLDVDALLAPIGAVR
jgi:cobyric acid synthase